MKIKKKISFLGPIGSYSYFAAIKYIKKKNKNYILKQKKNFQQIFESVEKKISDYAIIPIKNNITGFIDETYNLLCKTKLSIIEEFFLPINHCLIAKKYTTLNVIKKIYSHQQSLIQCSKFLQKFKYWRTSNTNSTSEAIKKIHKINTHNVAAIGNEKSAKIYNLHVILKNIANQINNKTKFIILAKNKKQYYEY